MNRTLLAATRATVTGLSIVLPDDRRRALLRRLRGLEEWNALRNADAAIVSYGKSGRTWLRLMLSRFYQQRFELEPGAFLEYDNLNRIDPAIPTVFFTHGNYLRDYTGHAESLAEDFGDRPLVLLVRDPRDIAVSQYFQWAHRMHPHKKWLNRYPPHAAELSVRDFVCDHEAGLDRALSFLLRWSEALPKCEQALVVRYEDLRAEPQVHLRRVLEFLGAEPRDEEITDAVEFAAFDNMRRLEEQGSVRATGQRLTPGRRGDTQSYKVRRAKVGGYRDYFDEETCAALEARVAEVLGPAFGYTAARATDELGHTGGRTES
ncbi:MAG: sulfotransferase domain-containing protein [Deltaproteobacteria bacterium]|nr:sulfotransferase domain-containing protein [Deltaproteobacteria bacterium]